MISLKGHLLIATPFLMDPNFHQTVLLMLDHDESGAVGIVLNRPTSTTLAEVSEQVFGTPTDWNIPIHRGGPVPGPLLALHNVEELADLRILPDLFTTSDQDHLRQLLTMRPEPLLLLANYAGWGPGQLESELSTDSWYTTSTTTQHVFSLADPTSWNSIVGSVRLDRLAQVLNITSRPHDPHAN